jgi:hypothetical protein
LYQLSLSTLREILSHAHGRYVIVPKSSFSTDQRQLLLQQLLAFMPRLGTWTPERHTAATPKTADQPVSQYGSFSSCRHLARAVTWLFSFLPLSSLGAMLQRKGLFVYWTCNIVSVALLGEFLWKWLRAEGVSLATTQPVHTHMSLGDLPVPSDPVKPEIDGITKVLSSLIERITGIGAGDERFAILLYQPF